MSRFTPGTLIKCNGHLFVIIAIKNYINARLKPCGKLYVAVNYRLYRGDPIYASAVSHMRACDIDRIRKLTTEEMLTHERPEVRALALNTL